MKIGLITVGVFGLVYVNLRDGVRNLDPRLFELAKVYHFSRATLFLRVLLPGALPGFMTGLRFALTVAWIALVTCETVNSSTGIGYMGLLSETIVTLLERAALPWRYARH